MKAAGLTSVFDDPSSWARFPLAAGVAIVAIDTLPSIGLPSGAGGLVFLAVVVSAFAHRWLPVIPVATRRLLVLPMGVVGAGAFDRMIGSNLPDIMGLATRSPKGDPTRAFLPLILAAVLMVYVMLVVAPVRSPTPRRAGGRGSSGSGCCSLRPPSATRLWVRWFRGSAKPSQFHCYAQQV